MKSFKEHIAYLDDGDFEYDPEEILELVGLPSGEFFQIRRKNYSRVQQWVNWSEKLQSYVFIDRFLPRILENLPLDDFHPYTRKNG